MSRRLSNAASDEDSRPSVTPPLVQRNLALVIVDHPDVQLLINV